MIVSKTLEILDKYNIHAKKKYGQNFLIDSNIIAKIIKNAGIDNSCGVIEIGPGLGAMTEALCLNAKKVLCYEIDSDMVNILNDLLKFDNLRIINSDFLKVDVSNTSSDLEYFKDCKEIKVVSNLPYYITTPIIFKLLEGNNEIKDFYFMVQKEVGERISGKPNTKDYNSLSVLVDLESNTEMIFDVSKNCFYPVPNVNSTILHIKRVKKDYGVKNKAKFVKFVQDIFSMRRKTLINNISNRYSMKKEEIAKVLEKRGYPLTKRAEELSTREIIDLYNDFFPKQE